MVRDDDGRSFVGEDEADPAKGAIPHVSSPAR
jgi:hypothetical protein